MDKSNDMPDLFPTLQFFEAVGHVEVWILWHEQRCVWKRICEPSLERGASRFWIVGKSDEVLPADEHGHELQMPDAARRKELPSSMSGSGRGIDRLGLTTEEIIATRRTHPNDFLNESVGLSCASEHKTHVFHGHSGSKRGPFGLGFGVLIVLLLAA